jgi:hypothetical protein
MAYRAPAAANVYPADAALNLPEEKHSHGLRRLAAIEAARGSFESAAAAVTRATGAVAGKRQVQELARRAAVDVDAFYAARRPGPRPDDELLVLTFDGKGVVMRPQALRPATARAAASTRRKLTTRLSPGEKHGRKRMAELAAVCDAVPAPRTAADIAAGFDEAERRDPGHRRTWVALVDGNTSQIEAITAQAARRHVAAHIVCDFIHVLEYLWKAAWPFFETGDADAETWVAGQAAKILDGKAAAVAAGIRRRATTFGYSPDERDGADTCAAYLTAKKPYLDYATALEHGWPIATGVIEGACRHLVKDRIDITGARWGLIGQPPIAS